MSLNDYLKGLARQSEGACEEFAKKCGTTIGQLRHVARGHRRAGESLAINVERESGGVIKCEDLRPDVDWAFLRGTNQADKKAA